MLIIYQKLRRMNYLTNLHASQKQRRGGLWGDFTWRHFYQQSSWIVWGTIAAVSPLLSNEQKKWCLFLQKQDASRNTMCTVHLQYDPRVLKKKIWEAFCNPSHVEGFSWIWTFFAQHKRGQSLQNRQRLEVLGSCWFLEKQAFLVCQDMPEGLAGAFPRTTPVPCQLKNTDPVQTIWTQNKDLPQWRVYVCASKYVRKNGNNLPPISGVNIFKSHLPKHHVSRANC